MNKISGVYKITNTITGDFYIGSSVDLYRRWTNHKSPSQWAHLPNSKLYQDMDQYGLNSFKFEVIEETDRLKEREQYWLEQLKPSYNNIRAIGHDIERYRQYQKDYKKEYYETHRDAKLNRMKKYNNSLCLYEGKTLTLNALRQKLYYQGISHPTLEAKKYLLDEEILTMYKYSNDIVEVE